MTTPFLRHLGFDEDTIKNLPNDIITASRLYDGMQKIYIELPPNKKAQKAGLAKVLAEGTRDLLIRINAVVAISPQVRANVLQTAQQMPPKIRPTLHAPTQPQIQTSPPPSPTQPPPPPPSQPTAKKRGRPKKVVSQPTPPSPPKKRGRPKKQTIAVIEEDTKQKDIANKLKNIHF